MAIDILFGGVSDSVDKASYVSSKLKSFFEYGGQVGSAAQNPVLVPDSELQTWTDFVCLHLKDAVSPPPLASKSQFPTITMAQQAAVNKSSACFIQEVNACSPLLVGEHLVGEGDFVTYLFSAYSSYAAGTPVLQRTTNLATLYYIATHVQVLSNGDLADVLPTPAATQPPPSALAVASVGDGLATQAENIAKGLVWALPPPWSAIGATLLNLLFPDSSNGIDWTTVFQQFSQIVLDADTETTVDTQDGLLNGVLADINDYVNTKTGQTKTALTIQLEGYLNTTNGIVGVLENSQFAQKGLATFVHAAGIELAILQEMAQQDPAVSDPLQSGHVTTIAQNAAAYATFATNTLNAVLDGLATQRGQQVSGVLHGRHCIYAGHGISDCTTYYYFNDPTANYTSAQYYSAGKHDDPAARCQTDRNNYASQVGAQNRVQKSAEAQWIWNTIGWWQKLVNTPLPQQPYSG